ncbi:aminotransferase class V-fold PLP-dependent enzyme [Hyalangium rubrum]|uniref:Aminotransferase class V-fold PLP-dependent enzyme n=1 Tax=Hyalangium rubrum TaxID=3103134 RepID=A0ABU5H151_9BACT|nr:aminotransferase class V-fold PLP-dependent enzyme [Hyalangium sp. s54d21]MDY7225835.1 aminotransferase class V-fold PLP-dependent enzyme [Hyalangium sp. s54d21]
MDLLSAVRAEFPLLQTCTYLNSSATGAMPRGVEAVLRRYWETMSTWRDEVWGDWLGAMQAHADGLANLLGAPAGSVALDSNLTTLLGRVGTCFDYRGERRRVVTTDMEFPTVPFLWKGFARYGAELVVVPSVNGRVDVDALCAAIDERTRLVSVSHASFQTGALLDVAKVARAAHAAGALIAVDAYQTVGAYPVDVGTLDVDFLLGGGHKWLCGSEYGFLYVRPSLTSSLEPAATGWLAGETPFTFLPAKAYAPDAQRMRAGTPVPLPVLLSRPGLELVSRVGMPTIRAHSLACTQRLIARADEAGLPVVTPRDEAHRGGVVVMRFPGDAEVSQRLVSRGFICSYRGGLRVGPHFYNTLSEVDGFMDALVAEARQSAA